MTDDHRFGGSSPRMRGAHNWLELTTPYKRIIPADAGSTPPLAVSACAFWDHPRGCGEHGSAHHRLTHIKGIIPADAGSTNCSPIKRIQ